MQAGENTKTRWRVWVVIAVVIVVIGAIAFQVFRTKQTQVSLVTVTRRTMQNKVFGSGTVRPVQKQLIMPGSISSTQYQIDVKAGDRIHVGQALVSTPNSTAAAAVTAARASVASAKSLLAAGLPSAAATLAQAQAQLSQAEAAYAATVVRAQIDGTAIMVNPNGVDSNGNQVPLVEVVSAAKKIVVNVSEADAVHLHPGLSAKITTDAYPNQTWTGKISSVAGYAVTNSSGSGQVEVDLSVPASFVVPFGYTVNVNIVSATHDKVPAIPYEALVQDGSGYAVYQYKNGRVNKTQVTLGITGNTFVEVTKGLTPGMKVVLNPPSSLQSGQAVNAS